MPGSILPVYFPQPEPTGKPKINAFSVRAHWLRDGDYRLDAQFYTDNILKARRAIYDSGFPVKLLGDRDVAGEIYNLPRFKRVYTSDPSKGYPYLSATEAMMFRLRSNRWIAREKAPDEANRHFPKAGWILVTCSGVVGRCRLVTRQMEQYFLTHDLLRVVPVLSAGYVYAFLSSWMAQALMVKEQYGGTIPHLEPHHLQRIPVPLLPDDQQQAIHQQIAEAYRLREQANDLLDQAEDLLYAELGLPRFDESQIPYLGSVNKPKAFIVKASELCERLDASFHLPIARAAVHQLSTGKYPLARLGELAGGIYIPPRFKRIYVGPEYGVPFLQGSHIPLMKPYDLKYLSRRAHADLSRWIIKAGWVLVTCSGTIGRVALVPRALDGWAASQHIERIKPNSQRLHTGFLAIFLMTPYGQHQLTSRIYGGVVDELTEADTATILVPDVPMNVQERIGSIVVDAFEKKEEANKIENQAISALEELLAKPVSR